MPQEGRRAAGAAPAAGGRAAGSAGAAPPASRRTEGQSCGMPQVGLHLAVRIAASAAGEVPLLPQEGERQQAKFY